MDMIQLLEGVPPYREKDIKRYIDKRWWRGLTLGDVLDRAADMHPDKEAFVDKTSRYTYGQAREKVDKLALGLIRLGIQPLERVLIQLPNWNEFVFAYFACQKIGAVTVLLIERYRHFEIDRLIRLTGATAWIVPKNTYKIDFMPTITEVLKSHPEVRNVVTVRADVNRPGFSCMENLIDDSELTAENVAKLARRNPDPMQVAHMGPTGGTTGEPKVVPRLHNSLVCGVESCSMSWNQHCEDVNLVAGPIGHDLSFTKGFLGAVITQGKVIFQSKLDNESICKTIEREKVSSIIWVPTLAKRMVQFEDLHKYDLRSLRKMHSAGGASHPDLVKKVMDRLDMKFYNGYGGTEGMTCITRCVDDYNTICCTVGRPTFPHDHYKVVDSSGKELPRGHQGELLVKGPCVFSGYYNNPEENSNAFDQDGYFKTGDLARIDEKGYISLTGRIKEMINRGGESISSTEIEKLINRHPDVAVAAVIAMPDQIMGEKACAYIELKGESKLTFDDIITFLKSQKASVLHLPERVEFIDSMPVTATQKLDKQALRSDIEDKLSNEVTA
jgi:2,3-dihydroxybenzoate-AMP ligase/mycobactin salicyl-AMP ligase